MLRQKQGGDAPLGLLCHIRHHGADRGLGEKRGATDAPHLWAAARIYEDNLSRPTPVLGLSMAGKRSQNKGFRSLAGQLDRKNYIRQKHEFIYIVPVLHTREHAYFARKGIFRPLVRRSGKNAVISRVFAVDRPCGQGLDGTTSERRNRK